MKIKLKEVKLSDSTAIVNDQTSEVLFISDIQKEIENFKEDFHKLK